MANQQKQPSQTSADSGEPSAKMTMELDPILHNLGFEIDEFTPSLVTGRLLVTPKCCQAYKVLHGGVSALIAESLASLGGFLANGFKRIAGLHVSIDHMRSAALGELVLAHASPINIGRTIQVWEVKLWKTDPTTMKNKQMISSARVIIICNLPELKNLKDEVVGTFRKHAKL